MNIFNVREISKRITKNNQIPNLYHKIYYLMKGVPPGKSALELIEEVECILDKEVEETKKFLSEMKVKINSEA